MDGPQVIVDAYTQGFMDKIAAYQIGLTPGGGFYAGPEQPRLPVTKGNFFSPENMLRSFISQMRYPGPLRGSPTEYFGLQELLRRAGKPHMVGREAVYDATPEDMAEYARKFVALGARVVGGCCGSTPEHIKAIAEAVA